MEINLSLLENTDTDVEWRLSSQPILPVKIIDKKVDEYDIYPYHSLDKGKIFNGYKSLADWIVKKKVVVIDGYSGVFWNDVRHYLNIEFEKQTISINWLNMLDYLKTSSEIQNMVSPFIGTLNSVWGTKCNLCLNDFYNIKDSIQPDDRYDINIVIGAGSALLNWNAPIIYLDLPKNELQFRMRAGSITNLGNNIPESASEMYKRFYFVDWVVLNEHKKNILDKMSLIADTQWKDTVNWVLAEDLKAGLNKITKSVLRVRPWFDRGVWGGQWMKERINGLNKEEINYAWSFELIVPENGIVFESDGNLLEISFDFLMFSEYDAVLGKHAGIFGYEFPIRFDFLDTWDGGNLSIQCHPSLNYIQEQFGENITQDETYYILDCQEKANVYLGFQEDIDPAKFRKELEISRNNGAEVEIEKYVQTHPAKKHDLFLIPNSTIHSAGAGNLVLEISATPYIFTFKMYDWLRLDLNGKPRAINIEHAFNNLNFERRGDKVAAELISKPELIEKGRDWELINLPTHKEHFYAVHRIEFDSELIVETNNRCHVLMLVEGTTLTVTTEDGALTNFHYAETFVIPAAAKKYTLINKGNERAKVIKAFLKDNLTI